MFRLSGILLSAVFLTTGSGAAAHVHRLEHLAGWAHQHPHDDADRSPSAVAHDDDARFTVAAVHAVDGDEDGCELCVVLAAPALPAVDPPPTLHPGLACLAADSAVDRPVVARTPLRIDCRGPPIA